MSAPAFPDEFAKLRSVVVLAPHPDDEILGCGHLMRAFTQAKTALAVIWLTDGGSAFGPLAAFDRVALAQTRSAEALIGLRAMEIAVKPFFLGFPDGRLAEYVEAAVERLRDIVRTRAAEAIFVTDQFDGHPDHVAAFRIASQIVGPAIYSYPVSGRYDGGAPDKTRSAITLRTQDGDVKRLGLACHVSQHEGGGAIFPMTASAIDGFCAHDELFYSVRAAQS